MLGALMAVALQQQQIAEELDARLKHVGGPGLQWSLFIWHPQENATNYLSTADRDEVMRVLGGMVDKWRAGSPPVPIKGNGR